MESTAQESCKPTDHRVIIAQRGNFVVRPGNLNVRRGDTVTWISIGTADPIFFPDKRLFGPDRRVLDVCREDDSANEAKPDDTPVVSESLRVLDDAPFKVYSYSIFCDTSNTFAQGGQGPELIVGLQADMHRWLDLDKTPGSDELCPLACSSANGLLKNARRSLNHRSVALTHEKIGAQPGQVQLGEWEPLSSAANSSRQVVAAEDSGSSIQFPLQSRLRRRHSAFIAKWDDRFDEIRGLS